MAYDATKPVTGGSLVAVDMRENFRALKEDDIVEGVVALGITEGMLAASAVAQAKLKAGMIMPSFSMDIFESERSVTGTAWESIAACKIYVPDGAQSISAIMRIKSDNVNNAIHWRFVVGELISSELGGYQPTSYEWYEGPTLDISALSGWQNIAIHLKAEAAHTCYLQGFAFKWD